MDCNFSKHAQRAETTVRIKAQEIPQKDSFQYLGSRISKDGQIEEDVEHKIRARWFKQRLASCVLCDRCIPTKLKGKFYKTTTIRLALTYVVECWPIKKQHMHKMSVGRDENVRVDVW